MSRTGVYREGDELMNNQRVLVITNMYPTSEHKSFGIFVKNQVDAFKKETGTCRCHRCHESKKWESKCDQKVFRLVYQNNT